MVLNKSPIDTCPHPSSSPLSPPRPSILQHLSIVGLIHCWRWCHCRCGRCIGSSSAATAAKYNCDEVDDGVKSLLLSAPPPPPWQKIRGQRHATEVLDCLCCYTGGWWQRWYAVAAGGVAMTLSAGGDKKGGTPLMILLARPCYVMGVTLTPILLPLQYHPRGALCCSVKTFKTDSSV